MRKGSKTSAQDKGERAREHIFAKSQRLYPGKSSLERGRQIVDEVVLDNEVKENYHHDGHGQIEKNNALQIVPPYTSYIHANKILEVRRHAAGQQRRRAQPGSSHPWQHSDRMRNCERHLVIDVGGGFVCKENHSDDKAD